MNFTITTVLLIRNNMLNIDFSNSSIGIIRDIVYNNDVLPPAQAKFILVNFGNTYKGETYFLKNSQIRRFPIHLVENKT